MPGQVRLVDGAGNVFEASPEWVAKQQADGALTYKIATDADVKAYKEKNRTTTAKDIAKGAAAGARAYLDASTAAALAPATAVAGVGAGILGTENPLAGAAGKMAEGRIAIATEAAGALGLTDVTGEAAARQYHEQAKGLAEQYPGATMAGDVVGGVAGGLASGGAVNAGRSFGARVGFGALEGAAGSYAQTTEDAYIRDKTLTGQQVAASVGLGALLGGGVQYGGEKLAGLLRRSKDAAVVPSGGPYRAAAEPAADVAPPSPLEQKAAQWLEGFSDDRTVKALGARGSDLRKLGRTKEAIDAKIGQIGRDVREHTLDDGTQVFDRLLSKEAQAERVALAKTQIGKKIGDMRADADVIVRSNKELQAQLTSDLSDAIKKFEAETLDRLKTSISPEDIGRAKQLSQLTETITARMAADPSLATLRAAKEDLARAVYGVPTVPGVRPLPKQLELQSLERTIEGVFEASADRAATYLPDVAKGEYAALKGKYYSFSRAKDFIDKSDAQNLGNRYISPSDYAMGAATAGADMVSGGGASVIKGLAATMLHKGIREHGSAVAAVYADRLAKRLAKKADKAVARALAPVAEKQLTRAVTRTKAPSTGLARRGAVVAGTAATKPEDKRTQYQKTAKEVIALQASPALFHTRTTEALGALPESAPQTTAAAVMTAQRAVAFLADQLPPGVTSTNPLAPNTTERPLHEVSKMDAEDFMELVDVVNNPLTVLDDLGKGTLTEDKISAVKTVYPELFADIQQRVLTALRDAKRPPPYDRAAQLDLLLDLNGAGEPSMGSAFQQRYAQATAAAQAARAAQNPPQMTRPPQVADKQQTLSERLETT